MIPEQYRLLLEKYHFLFLFFILLSAFFIRAYDLADDPPGLYMDEVSSAYNAWSILKTGKDEHGNLFPVYFEAFGEYRHGLYIYSMIPSLFVFGLNDFGTRFTSVIFGILSIIVLYFLAKRLFDTNIALLSTALFAIQPWHMHLSRVAFEGISFVFLFLLAFLLFFKGFEKKYWLFFSALLFGLSVYSYGVAKLFVPLFLLGLLVIYRKYFWRENQHLLFLCFFLFALTAWPIYYLSFFGEGNARFQEGSVFVLSEHPVFSFFINYVSHYSSSFLFFEGDAGLRHHLYQWGVLYHFDILFVLLGLVWLFRHRTDKRAQILFLWLILFPVAASFMHGDTPHVLRTFIGAPVFILLSALGIQFLWQLVSEKYLFFSFLKKISLEKLFLCFVLLLGIGISVEAGFYLHEYFTDYKIYSYDYWMAYAKPLMAYVIENRDQYDHAYFSSGGFSRFGVYILYAIQADPLQYQEKGLDSFGYAICNMENNETCINESQHNLYIFRGFELPTMNGTHNIYYPNNDTIAVKMVG